MTLVLTTPPSKPYASPKHDYTPAAIERRADTVARDAASIAVSVMFAMPDVLAASGLTGEPPRSAAERASVRSSHSRGETRAEQANEDRIQLLAREYAKKDLSPEDRARLEIATERVAQLMPRVTANDFEELAAMASQTIETRRRLDERKAALGLGPGKR